jgi:YggT family protein
MTSTLEILVQTAFRVVYLLILARAILSWVPTTRYHPAVIMLHRTTEPLLLPFRRLLPPWRTGGLDVSPILLIVALWVVESVIVRAIPG